MTELKTKQRTDSTPMTNKEYIETLKFLKEEVSEFLDIKIKECEDMLVPDAECIMPYGLPHLKRKIDHFIIEVNG